MFEWRQLAPPSSESQTPTAEIATISRLGSPGQGAIVCRQRPPVAGAPVGPGRVIPEPAVELPGGAAVTALEQDARVAAAVDEAVLLTRDDHPEALERLLLALRQLEALALLPLAGRVVRDPHLRAVEPRRHRREVAPGARVARRVLDRLARERPCRDLERPACVALEHEQALPRAHQKLCHRSPPVIDGRTCMRSVGPTASSSCAG